MLFRISLDLELHKYFSSIVMHWQAHADRGISTETPGSRASSGTAGCCSCFNKSFDKDNFEDSAKEEKPSNAQGEQLQPEQRMIVPTEVNK